MPRVTRRNAPGYPAKCPGLPGEMPRVTRRNAPGYPAQCPGRPGNSRRRLEFEQVSFTFCGFTFRPRRAYNTKEGQGFTSFLPAVAPGKLTDMSRKAASWRLQRRTTLTLDDLAEDVNPVLRGWLNYFTTFYPTAVIPIGRRMDRHLRRWARRKYKRLERSDKRARVWLKGVRKRSPGLFAHWELRYTT